LFAFAALGGCGGRSNDGEVGDPDGDPSGSGAPLPTCAEICRNMIDRCVPGAPIEKCAASCEAIRTSRQGCAALDVYLRCMPTVPVECGNDQVTIVGCHEEYNALSRCTPP
jgi:hypothetical protein